MKKIQIENTLLSQIGHIADHVGVKVYAVGGYVRDLLLGEQVKDIDFVVIGDGPAFAKQVGRYLHVSSPKIYKTFGTAMLRYKQYVLEFVGARKESYRINSRKPKVEQASLEEDLARRDFTMNAMALSLNHETYGQLLDPFKGKKDLEEGVLRTPLEPAKTFHEDPLRMMRAIRFATRFNFTIYPETLDAISESAFRLDIISQERITDELFKILSSKKPSPGFTLMDQTGVLDIVLPEIAALKGVEQVDQFRHKDVFKHTLKVLDNVARFSDKVSLRFVALFHDIAKPDTKKFQPGIGWTFHGHEELGSRMIKSIGKRLRVSKDLIQYAQKMIRLHLRPIQLVEEHVTDSAIRRLLFNAGSEIDDLIVLCRADITSKNPNRVAKHLENFDHLVERIQQVEEKDRMRMFQSPVRGDEIMRVCHLEPGPKVGKIKKQIEEAILNGEIPNDYQAAFDYLLKIRDQGC